MFCFQSTANEKYGCGGSLYITIPDRSWLSAGPISKVGTILPKQQQPYRIATWSQLKICVGSLRVPSLLLGSDPCDIKQLHIFLSFPFDFFIFSVCVPINIFSFSFFLTATIRERQAGKAKISSSPFYTLLQKAGKSSSGFRLYGLSSRPYSLVTYILASISSQDGATVDDRGVKLGRTFSLGSERSPRRKKTVW